MALLVRLSFLFVVGLFASTVAQARCTGRESETVLKARFTGCSIERIYNFNEVLGKQLLERASAVCENQCYILGSNPTRERECNRRHVTAIRDLEVAIVARARAMNCRDVGSFDVALTNLDLQSGAPAAPAMPPVAPGMASPAAPAPAPAAMPAPPAPEAEVLTGPARCRWIALQGAALKCDGSNRNTNICGRAERTICSGHVYCDRGGELAGEQVRTGEVLALACTHRTDDCRTIDIESCALDPTMAPLEAGLSPAAPAPAADPAMPPPARQGQ